MSLWFDAHSYNLSEIENTKKKMFFLFIFLFFSLLFFLFICPGNSLYFVMYDVYLKVCMCTFVIVLCLTLSPFKTARVLVDYI